MIHNDRGNEFKSIKKITAANKRSNSGIISLGTENQKNKMEMRKGAPSKDMMPINEEELSASAREYQKEKELNAINEGYKNKKDEMVTTGAAKIKPGTGQLERQFQPFKSPFVDEIINTSKEVNDES